MSKNSSDNNWREGSGKSRQGGLFDGFEGYKSPTEEDYHEVLTEGLIVPDTSVLLSLYRYNQQARSDLLSVLRSFGDRLFVPRQVMTEFWRNRDAVLRDPLQGQAVAKELLGYRTRSIDAIRSWANRAGFRGGQAQELSGALGAAFDAVLSGLAEVINKEGGGFASDTGSDPVLAELETILMGHVGAELEDAEYRQAAAEAKRRGEAKIPPGYMDAKKDEGSGGDYLIWLETINETKIRMCDVLVVTGDAKEDWWRRERGEIRGPRPELVQEMKAETGARLFMLRPDSLLLRAQQVLSVEVHDESVKDVERVTDQRESEDGAEFGEDAINRSWNKIMGIVRKRSRAAGSLLGTASVAEVNDTSVTLAFQRRADAEGFAKRHFDQMLGEVMSELFNVSIDVTVTF